MSQKFLQLKKQAAFKTLLWAILTGVSFGLLVFGALFTVFKLTAVAFPWYVYLCSALGGALIVGGIILLVFYPTTKRFAKHLDEEYALDEKVRTMVEYSGRDGAILQLQREQTDRVLSALPKKKRTPWDIIKVAITPFLAVAMLTTSFIVPNKAVAEPPVEPPIVEKPFEWNRWQNADLETLITNVENSSLIESLKTPYLATLRGLLSLIQTKTASETEVLKSVSASMSLIIALTKEENTYNAYVAACKGEETLKPLATALTSAGKAYEKIAEINLLRYSTVENRTEELNGAITEVFTAYTNGIMTEINACASREQYTVYIEGYTQTINGLLASEDIVALPTDEGIKVALGTVKEGLTDTLVKFDEGATLDGVKTAAKRVFNGFILNGEERIAQTMTEQANSFLIKDYVLYTLGEIFDVGIPKESEGTEDEEGEAPPPDVEGEGTDNINDGLVLKPDGNGSYVPYTDLISTYLSYIQATLAEDKANAEANGEELQISGELEKIILDFFVALQKE